MRYYLKDIKFKLGPFQCAVMIFNFFKRLFLQYFIVNFFFASVKITYCSKNAFSNHKDTQRAAFDPEK
jgi:hypothetical protein